MEYEEVDQSKVYSSTKIEDVHKLHDLTIKMQQLATNVKRGYERNNVVTIVDNSRELADMVLTFLKVASWSR